MKDTDYETNRRPRNTMRENILQLRKVSREITIIQKMTTKTKSIYTNALACSLSLYLSLFLSPCFLISLALHCMLRLVLFVHIQIAIVNTVGQMRMTPHQLIKFHTKHSYNLTAAWFGIPPMGNFIRLFPSLSSVFRPVIKW